MSRTFLYGSGSVSGPGTTPFNLLKPQASILDDQGVYGASEFTYDFYVKKTNLDAGTAIWKINSVGIVGEDELGNADTAFEVGDNQESLIQQVPYTDGTHAVELVVTTGGAFDYWYALKAGRKGIGGFPTVTFSTGVIDNTTEFYLRRGRTYTVATAGTTISVQYAEKDDALIGNAGDWTAIGTSQSEVFECPATGRIRLVPGAGALDFTISSRIS